jgi:hypothetical protein
MPRAVPRAGLAALCLLAVLAVPGVAQAAPSASFTFSPNLPLTLQPVTFNSTSTGVVPPQTWDFDNDGACDDATGATVQRTFDVAGEYPVKLCVTDGIDSSTQTRRVVVLNRAPIAAMTYAPASPLVGDTVLLTSTSVDPDGPIAAQAWDLDGDGAYDDGAGETASLAVSAARTYPVQLLVIDADGATDVATTNVVVGGYHLMSPFAVVRAISRVTRRGTRIRELAVEAPAGSKVQLRCRGRRCPVRRLTRTVGASRLLKIRRLKRSTLRPRAAVKVWVTKADAVGKYTRFRIRRGLPPARADRCLTPGARLPVKCPGT